MIRSIISWCIDNRFMVCLLTVLVTAAGIWSMRATPVDAIPDLSDVQVIVYSQWMGRDPQTIEDQVTYPLTTKMLGVPKVKVVRGYSFFGFSLAYVIFEDGTDIYWARSRVLEYLSDIMGKLPADVTTSLGPDATGVGWVYEYTLEDTSGQYDLGELRAIQDWYLRYQLTALKGVAEVASIGGFERQFQVQVDPNRLATFGIPIKRVIDAVKRSNNDVGGRLLEMGETEFMVRGRGYIRSVHDIEETVVGTDGKGTPIRVRDLATVALGSDLRRGIAEKNGEGEVVAGVVVMRFGENALEVIERVKKKISELSKGLPPGMVIRTAYDRSSLILRSLETLKKQLSEEMAIVALTCVVFLLHARSALVAAVTLPLGILLSFIVMYQMGLNSNIMSLGGIAIAIGAMVDAAVVMVENAHKHLEGAPESERWARVKLACLEVGPALFSSLLVITVAFLPVFVLREQAGRMFKPLAYTKTFAMAASALVAITITPVLIGFFVRGRIFKEEKNPVSRLLVWLYVPVLTWALRWRKTTVAIAVCFLASSYYPYSRLGSEFMPPLNEGDILYMPTSLPGISESEARRTLQIQDALFAQFPEVLSVLGKIGRAETATDPAPLSMVETTVRLKEPGDWPARKLDKEVLERRLLDELRALARDGSFAKPRSQIDLVKDAGEVSTMVARDVDRRIRLAMIDRPLEAIRPEVPAMIASAIRTYLGSHLRDGGLLTREAGEAVESRLEQRITASRLPEIALVPVATLNQLMYEDMDPEFRFPGLTNAWTMPIKTRIDMLATGIKTPIGIKVFGPDLLTLERIAIGIEEIVKKDAGTLSAIAERVMGGHYLDFDIDRDECARYGLTIGDVQDVVETAIGGKNITQTVEGLYRFRVNVRYPPELRDDPKKLEAVLVAAPGGRQIPLGQLARVVVRDGPPAIKSENSMRQAIVYVDIKGDQDVGRYVERVRQMVDAATKLPPGYYVSWSGQYEYMLDVNRRLRVIVPLTLVIIFLLVYLEIGKTLDTLAFLLALPFAVIGGVWYMWLLDFNFSIAVGIGFIAVAGLAAETSLIMHAYLDIAYKKRASSPGGITHESLQEAIIDGAALRVRPKMMTVMTTILGLAPIMWATGTGAGPMMRMAAPMIGGLVTSTIHTLVLIPVYYAMIEEMRLRRESGHAEQ